MRSRVLILTTLVIVVAVLAGCSALPSLTVPTVAPALAEPAATSAAAEPAAPAAAQPGTSPLPAPTAVIETTAPVTPTVDVSATVPIAPPTTPPITPQIAEPITPQIAEPITATLPMTPTAEAAPAIYGTPVVTETVPVSPRLPESQPLQTAGTNTYRDETGGFEMDFPAAWWVVDVAPDIKQQSSSYSSTFMSWEPQEPGGHGIPEGGSKIDITVTKDGAASLGAAAESRRQQLTVEGAGITFEEPWNLPGGLAATHWTVEPASGPTIDELVTAINGNSIVATGLGDLNVFQQIIATLRPLGTQPDNSAVIMSASTPAPEARGTEQPQGQVAIPMVSASGDNAAAAPAAATTVYAVRQGDTLVKIAARFGVSVAAILKVNPQIKNADHIYIGQRINIPASGGTQPPAATMPLNIYMIGMGGGNVGCGDQVIAVRRDIPKTTAPLTEALNQLLSQKSQYYGQSGLYNALYQSNLSIGSITRSGSDWTVQLNGTLQLGGVCDNPRVKAQLEQTALQFPTVKSVKYFINGKPLDTQLSGK